MDLVQYDENKVTKSDRTPFVSWWQPWFYLCYLENEMLLNPLIYACLT